MRTKVHFFGLPWRDTRNIIVGFVLAIPFLLIHAGCFEENEIVGADLDVRFSTDTLRFDTVFTEIGSATRSFTIINNRNENVVVSTIRLDQGNGSMFRMNVDGISGSEVNDVLILAEDSIHVFVEVTVDPDAPISVSPFIITESITVESGSVSSSVLLEARGQNANYFPSRDARGRLIGLTCNSGELIWNDPKPYIVFGLLFIDSCTLVIPKGTQVYVHGGLGLIDGNVFDDGGLFFLENGRLLSQGNSDSPVVFQGARLESSFSNISGQWSGIRFLSGSRENSLSNTIIKNSIVGIRSDSAASVSLDAVQIFNTSGIGIIGVHSEIQADNCLVHSNGVQSVALTYGGDYIFRYCTFASYQNQSPALYMDNFNCVNEDCSIDNLNPISATFINSIIMGSNDDEIQIVDLTEGTDPSALNLIFDHSLIRVLETKAFYPVEACQGCLEFNDEPVFRDQNMDDYKLDTVSLARDQGVPIGDILSDLTGQERDANSPDIGCYEF